MVETYVSHVYFASTRTKQNGMRRATQNVLIRSMLMRQVDALRGDKEFKAKGIKRDPPRKTKTHRVHSQPSQSRDGCIRRSVAVHLQITGNLMGRELHRQRVSWSGMARRAEAGISMPHQRHSLLVAPGFCPHGSKMAASPPGQASSPHAFIFRKSS